MSGSPVQPGKDLAALTGLRGIAAWFVVLYHIRMSAAWQLPPELTALIGKGYLAVDLFFMLSGFVLWLNYSDRLRSEGLAAAPRFLARRVARIWPLHLFVLAGAIVFAGVLQSAGKLNPVTYPWAELPLHILLVQNWGFTSDLTWNVPAWSISCELAAYLLFPLLALALDWRRLHPAAIVAAIAALTALLSANMQSDGAALLGDDVPRFGLLRAVCEFTIGTAVCGLWFRWRETPLGAGLVSALAALALALGWLTGTMAETLAVPLLFAAVLLMLALSAGSSLNPLGWRPVHYLGRISYSTYLIHYLLFILFKLLVVTDVARVPLVQLGGFLVLTLLASILLHHLVELPGQRAVNRAFAALRPERTSLSAA